MSLPLVAHWNIRPRFCIAEDTTHFYHRTKESTDCESSSMVLSSSSSKRCSQCCGREKWFLVLTSQKNLWTAIMAFIGAIEACIQLGS